MRRQKRREENKENTIEQSRVDEKTEKKRRK
jgi:hypothetical protein